VHQVGNYCIVKSNGALHHTFLTVSRALLLRMKSVSAQDINTHILCSAAFFWGGENRAVYETMCQNIVEPGRPRMKIWRMRIAYWIPKATNTHSEYATLIAFPLQQWLH